MSITSLCKNVGVGRPIPSSEWPDLEQAARFLTLLDETAKRWTFQTFDDLKSRKDPNLTRLLHGTLEEHWEELCRLSALGAGVFMVVNETNGRGRKTADIIRVRAVFQEADRPGTPEPPLQPHLVVESSPGKYHRYLRVEGGHRFDLFEQVMACLVLDFGSDPNAKDRARVLRLPGFSHQKDPANPWMVRVIHESGEQPYSWDEITAKIPPLLIEKKSADVPPGKGIDDPAKVRSALAALDSDLEYSDWLAIGMALHHATAGGAEGLALWEEWSARGRLYRLGETAYKWASFGHANGQPVTLATVFKLASNTGWRWKAPSKGNRHDNTVPPNKSSSEQQDKDVLDGSKLESSDPSLPYSLVVRNGESVRLVRTSKAAKILARYHGDKIAYDLTARAWQKYTGTHWTELNDDAIFILTAKWVDAGAGDVGYGPEYVRGTIDLMRSHLAVERFDNDPALVPFTNGVLNVKTQELSPHSPNHHITWCLPFDYDPTATCEPVIAWLYECVSGDALQVELLRAYLKAVLTGRSDFQRYLELIGPGGGGKGTFTRLAESIVGSRNTHATSLKRLETNRFETAQLYNVRLCVITDSERYGGEMSVLKAMTGQDTLPNERKHQQHGEPFKFSGMVLISGNENIGSADLTSGLQRRRITVRFDNPVPPALRRDLEAEFLPYLSGVVTWCLAMDDERMRQLLVETTHYVKSLAQTAIDALLDTNPIAAWAHDFLVLDRTAETPIGKLVKSTKIATDDTDVTTKHTTVEYGHVDDWLYPSYYQYCASAGNRAVSSGRFTGLLKDLLIHQLKLEDVQHITQSGNLLSRFRGIRLRRQGRIDEIGVFPSSYATDSRDSKGYQKDSKRIANGEDGIAKQTKNLFINNQGVEGKHAPPASTTPPTSRKNTANTGFAIPFTENASKTDSYENSCYPFDIRPLSVAIRQGDVAIPKDSKSASAAGPHDDSDDPNYWESVAAQQPPDKPTELELPAAGTLLDHLSALAHVESAPPPQAAVTSEPVKRKPAPKTIRLIQHPDCRQCQHFRERSRTCVKVLIGIAHPTDPVCRGQHFQPKEARS